MGNRRQAVNPSDWHDDKKPTVERYRLALEWHTQHWRKKPTEQDQMYYARLTGLIHDLNSQNLGDAKHGDWADEYRKWSDTFTRRRGREPTQAEQLAYFRPQRRSRPPMVPKPPPPPAELEWRTEPIQTEHLVYSLPRTRTRPKAPPPPGEEPDRILLPDPPPWGIRWEWEPDGGTCGIDWSRVPGMVTEVACPVVQPGRKPRRSCGRRGYIRSWQARRLSILVRDGWKCLRCGFQDRTGTRLHADHVVPISPRWQGRERCMANLQTLCQRCNLRKGDRNCSDYREPERVAWGLARCDCRQDANEPEPKPGLLA